MYEMETNYQERYLQPIQQLALQKQPYQINGVQFFCQQSFYEGQLLNGVDLKVKQLKGLNPNPSLIDYLPDSQQLIFSASSSLVTYSTHKKNYHQLLNLEGEVIFLKVHFDKNNSRQYIIWVEKHSYVKQNNLSFSKTSVKKFGNLIKRRDTKSLDQQEKPDFFKSLLGNFLNKSAQSQKKQQTQSNLIYTLKIFDFTRKETIFQRDIAIKDEKIKDLFLFVGTFRMVGYILQKQDRNRRLYFKQMAKRQTKGGIAQFQSRFQSIEISQNIKNLKFNSQQHNYVFFDNKIFYTLYPQEVKTPENSTKNFQNLIFQNLQENLPQAPSLSVVIKKKAEFQVEILCLAFNDQYLAILTANKIYFHSAFDTSCLIFIHQIQDTNYIPLGIQFNKSTLYMTYRNIPKITTFNLKSRALKQMNSTTLQLQHCKEICKIFCNNISSELFCVIMFYQLESRVNQKISEKYQPNMVQYFIKPAFVDVSMSFLSPSAKTQVKILNIAKQKYQKVHICPWLSNYIVEAQSQVTFGQWKQNFQNKKCLCLHPTGIYMVVCFKDSFKIYVISFDGLVNTFLGDTANDIQACAISTLGHHLAIVTSNLIVIYDFYSCKKNKVITLPIGSSIQLLQYSDFALCCFLKNKKFYAFDSFNDYREIIAFNPKSFILQSSNNEVNLQNTNNLTYQLLNYISLRSVFYDPSLELILFSVKNNLYFYNCRTNSIILTAQMSNITAFHYCKALKTLFLGTEDGELLSYSWPNKPANFTTDQRKYKLHGGQIISIAVSADFKEVVTLGDDNSLCICQLTYVQNLKRLEGLELIEYLTSNVPINYDLLSRKGIYQYTHSKFNEKLDLIKDFEEEAQNINFILPEQRLKQKQYMLNNISDQKKQRLSKADQEYIELNRLVEEIKQKNKKLRETMSNTEAQIGSQLQQTKKNNLKEYMSKFNTTQETQKQLIFLKQKCRLQREKLKKQFNKKLQEEKQSYNQHVANLQQKFINQKKSLPKYYFEELEMIDQQKKIDITLNIDNLKKSVLEYHQKNGKLTCKNNNVEKQILQLKRRIQQRKYLLQRLNASTKALVQEQKSYEDTKHEKQKRLIKQDKVNLTQIQKRYVKQTKVLIEKDKQISILTTNYNKEKGMLIHLEKVLESLETSIQEVVQNILDEKEQSKKVVKQIQQMNNQFNILVVKNVQMKKDRTSLKSYLSNFILSIELVLSQIITSTKENIRNILHSKQIFTQLQTQKNNQKSQEDEILVRKVDAKITNFSQNVQNKDKSFARSQPKSLTNRKCITQGIEDSYTTRQKKNQDLSYGSLIKQELIEKGSKKIYQKLKTENKIYQRIKTEQIVYQNKRKKISLQNEDLIENYNNLVMQNKKIENILKKQDSLSKISLKKIISRKPIQNNMTPFQRYLENKTASTKRLNKIVVPTQSYSIDS